MNRYWVLGGAYADISFRQLKDANPTVEGPFDTEQEAKDAWRRLSRDASSLALTRFSILSEKFLAAR